MLPTGGTQLGLDTTVGVVSNARNIQRTLRQMGFHTVESLQPLDFVKSMVSRAQNIPGLLWIDVPSGGITRALKMRTFSGAVKDAIAINDSKGGATVMTQYYVQAGHSPWR